jgi:DNA segregation ATPase FtsK/SpoIIIE, S-DNA-T family
VEFQITVADVRDPGHPTEIDCVISVTPGHRVAELSAALSAMPAAGDWAPGGWDSRVQGETSRARLWLGATRLPEDQLLSASGIRAGARLGLGGPLPGAGPAARGVAELRVVSGPDSGLTVPLTPGEHLLGREGAIRLENTDVSRRHCVITVASDGASFTLRDVGSQNGTGLDGVPIGTAHVPVRPGQLIQAGRDVLTIIATAGDESPIALRADPGDPFGLLVNRQMRTAPVLPDPVVIDLGSGARQEKSRAQWLIMILGPAVSVATGVALGAVTHQWLFLLLSLGGTVASLVPQLVNRRSAAGHAKAGRRQLAAAADAARARLADMTAAEEQARRAALPDPAALGRIATEPGARLWERTPDDEDFLRLRLGTGDLPARTVSVRGDGEPAGPHGAPDGPAPQILRDVPVAADLAALGVLGIAGHPRGSRAALTWVVAQLAVAHAPGDLRLVLLTETPRSWHWARWLPHLRPPGDPEGWLSVGTDPGTRAKRVAELRDLIDDRNASAGPHGGGYGAGYGGRGYGGRGRRDQLPLVVVIIDGSAGVRDIPGIDQVLVDGPAAGVFVICRDDDARELPGACGARLDTDTAGAAGRYTERDSGATVPVTRLDRVSERWAHEVARALAPLKDRPSAREGGTNAAVRLNDLWGFDRASATAVEKLWRQSGGRSTAAPVGRLADGSPFVLDIARQGPHMLVGGTTGSGKSQFLQTLVASLALGSTPQALNFVLIDYKGGATFQPCKDLPHVSGYLTDLDEHLGQRALAALEAESKYREWLITELAGCPDIETYWAAGEPQGPLPRLLVIADEFRFLKETMPEVLKGMTDLAARGRSIGIHLVLATQSPAKAITEDIRDNTKLRVCFRVEEKDGSVNVIDIPDAAGIDPSLKGRGFARVHHGAATRFQGAWASAPAGAGAATGLAALRTTARPFEMLGEPLADGAAPQESTRAGYSGPTDLSELVKAVQDTGRRPPEHRAWLDPLPPLIPLAALPAVAPRDGGLLAPVAYGMADITARQRQEPLVFDLERGSNLLIGGAGRSGRTTALRTIAARLAAGYSPADVHLYALDCDAGLLAPLARLPHCGAVVRRTEAERAGRLLDRLDAEVARRQDLLVRGGFTTITEQRRAVAAQERLPYLVLLLDRWEAFNSDLGQLDNQRLTMTLNRLLSEGAAAGLRVIVTGGLSALNKLGGNCPERIVLRLSSPNDLYSAGVPRGAMPDQPTEGRGLLLPATEVQIAFVGADPDGPAQSTAMNELIGAARFAFRAPTPAPLRVDALPPRITLAEASALRGWPGHGPLRPVLAVGGDELDALGPDLDRYPGFAIAGPLQSGKSTALVVLAESLLAAGTAVIGLAPRESPLRRLEGREGVITLFKDERPDPHKLLEVLKGAAGPLAVLVDDVDALDGQPADELLGGVPAKARDRGWALVITGSATHLGRGTRNSTGAVRPYKCGLLLTPEDTQQAMLFGARLPRSAVFDRPAGRGYLIQAGQPVLVQVPEVSPGW